MRIFFALLVISGLCLASSASRASDHADPALPAEFQPELAREPNITGLFAFPNDDQLVVVLAFYPSLTIAPPYALEDYQYHVYMDLSSEINYEDLETRVRYGGHVVKPEGISADVTISLELSNDAALSAKNVSGLNNPESIRWEAGVRDDPFIFTPFFGTNVVAVVMSIPMSSFPAGQQDWILWATSSHRGSDEIIDHVGRGLRTQLPRFPFLNTIPPSEHVAAITEKAKTSEGITKFIMEYAAPTSNLWEYIGAIRYYDGEPDVSIFTTRFPPGFPNGRRLEDDIAAIACPFGECILNELAITVGKTWPRSTVNDKPFLTAFPYVAEPWPNKPPPEGRKRLLSPQTTVKLVIGIIVALFLLNIFLLIRCWRRNRKSS